MQERATHVPSEFPRLPDMQAETAQLLTQIPSGCVSTYGDLAEALGDKIASRYVGQFMLDHQHNDECGCHRVVRADGHLGKYITGRPADKAMRLAMEGLVTKHERIASWPASWSAFRSERPLAKLRAYQDQVARHVDSANDVDSATLVGGVDVSFVPHADVAVAAIAIVDLRSQALVYHKTCCQSVRFPYISSYLAFRELPLLEQLVDVVRQERPLPPVLLVDGSGILHPRRCGIASMLGVSLGLATIGVTKKLLYGEGNLTGLEAGQARGLSAHGQRSGYALLPGSSTQKPLYVSPGAGVDVDQALQVVRRTLTGRRLPEPIYWADRLSRQAARQL